MRSNKKTQAKINRANKDTMRRVIQHILARGPATMKELMTALPVISRSSISTVASDCRSRAAVLYAPPRSPYRRDPTVISLGIGFKEAFEEYGKVSEEDAEKWASVLAQADSMIRRFWNKSMLAAKAMPREDISRLSNLLDTVSVKSADEEKLRQATRGILQSITENLTELLQVKGLV